MNKEQIQQRKQQFWMALPILVLPFIALLFYALGGGTGVAHNSGNGTSALSMTLPAPLFDDSKPMDKLSLYQQAAKDSMDKERDAAYDPFAAWMPAIAKDSLPPADKSPFSYSAMEVPSSGYNMPLQKQPPETALEQKIAQLEKMLQAQDTPAPMAALTVTPIKESSSEELQQLEAMMAQFASQSETQAGDPEMEQMDGMLSKILDIQHPDRIKERLRNQSLENKRMIYPLTTEPVRAVSDLLAPVSLENGIDAALGYNLAFLHQPKAIGFYDDEEALESASQNAVAAIVHEKQTLVSGATIRLRLQQNAYLQGKLLLKGSLVYGTCALNGDRLEVKISSLRHGHSILPVALITYDMDGLPGLRIPGSINRDVSKEGTEQALQTLSMGSLDPSIGAQATAAGIDAAKNLLTRKVKLVKVVVKAGYPLLLASEQMN